MGGGRRDSDLVLGGRRGRGGDWEVVSERVDMGEGSEGRWHKPQRRKAHGIMVWKHTQGWEGVETLGATQGRGL